MESCKIRIKNAENSRKIQEMLFEKGVVWESESRKVIHTDKPFLYVRKNRMTYGYSEIKFKKESLPHLWDLDIWDAVETTDKNWWYG